MNKEIPAKNNGVSGYKGGAKQHVPYEQPDNLESRQVLSIIDLLCEGEIEGFPDGLKNVYLNDTPIQSSNGEFNFKGIDAEWKGGIQGQAPLEAFPATENEIGVGLKVTKETPITRSIIDPNINRIRLTVGVNSLISQNQENGDTYGSRVDLEIQVSKKDGTWETKLPVKIEGKTRSQFLKSVIIDELPETPFNLRVVRMTDDSKSMLVQNDSLWSSYTEIFDIKLSYPNTALAGLKFDSSQFSGVPRRNYLVKGLVIKIPDNYDPVRRDYAGIWTGNFKLGWTDNPAWILYDIITNERYGLGNKVGNFSIDKFQLYSIAMYCDGSVPNGFGSTEPRFTCNCHITNQKQAYDIITSICSVFRAMPIWDGVQMTAIIDRKTDPVAIYTNANVIDGKFEYSSSSRKDRHNAVHVKYVDKTNSWKGATEYVSDDALIVKNGLKTAKFEAFGCTSRGQAHRIGKWMIATENLEKMVVNFSLQREGLRHLPGDIIILTDNTMNPALSGGRIQAFSGNTVTLDRTVKTKAGDIFTYSGRDGKPITTTIQAQVFPNQITTVDAVITGSSSIWTIRDSQAKQKLFKALSFTENKDGQFSVTAAEHNPDKEEIVDKGASFDPDHGGSIPMGIPPVENISINITPDSTYFQARVTWRIPRSLPGLKFEVKLLRGENSVSRNIVAETFITLNELQIGKYQVQIRGIDTNGRVGDFSTASFTIDAPAKPVQLDFSPDITAITIIPRAAPGTPNGTLFDFYKGENEEEVLEKKNYIGRGLTLVDTDVQPDTIYWYGAAAVNSVGESEIVTGMTKSLEQRTTGGGIFRIQTKDGIFPKSDEETSKLFYETFQFYPGRDTVLILYSLDESGLVNHSEQRMFDGSAWIIPALFLDGNLIASGTILGDRIKANTEIITDRFIGKSIEVESITTALGLMLPTVGEFKYFPFRKDDLPTGWFICDGAFYDVESEAGKMLLSLPENYKKDWGINIVGNAVSIPNLFNDKSSGYFVRPVDGNGRQVGITQEDAVRDISGYFPTSVRWWGEGDWRTKGVFKDTTQGGSGFANGGGDNYLRKIEFNLKNIDYPIADEIRPMNIGMTPAIYLGVRDSKHGRPIDKLTFEDEILMPKANTKNNFIFIDEPVNHTDIINYTVPPENENDIVSVGDFNYIVLRFNDLNPDYYLTASSDLTGKQLTKIGVHNVYPLIQVEVTYNKVMVRWKYTKDGDWNDNNEYDITTDYIDVIFMDGTTSRQYSYGVHGIIDDSVDSDKSKQIRSFRTVHISTRTGIRGAIDDSPGGKKTSITGFDNEN